MMNAVKKFFEWYLITDPNAPMDDGAIMMANVFRLSVLVWVPIGLIAWAIWG